MPNMAKSSIRSQYMGEVGGVDSSKFRLNRFNTRLLMCRVWYSSYNSYIVKCTLFS